MDDSKPSSNSLYIFTRVMFLIFSSGLLIHATYIYGFTFYQGYISELGFDYPLFPISRIDSYTWAYFASVNFGAGLLAEGLINFLAKLFLFGAVVFLLTLIWRSLPTFNFEPENDQIEVIKQPKWVVFLKEDYPKIYEGIRRFVLGRFFERMFSSLVAFQVVNICALILLVWVLFPTIGSKHGKQFGEQIISSYKESLCAKYENDWDWCISIYTEEVSIKGRLVLKDDNLLGIYTMEGPSVISMPDNFSFARNELDSITE